MSSAESLESTLAKLWEDNDLPSAPRLLKLAKRQGLQQATRKDVDRFLAAQAENQIFRGKRNPYPGAFHSSKKDEKWAIDLIDFSKRPPSVEGFRFILAVQDVYTRRLYLEPLVGKTPDLILAAYKRIERRAGASPSVLTSDKEGGVLAEPMQRHLIEVDTNLSLIHI